MPTSSPSTAPAFCSASSTPRRVRRLAAMSAASRTVRSANATARSADRPDTRQASSSRKMVKVGSQRTVQDEATTQRCLPLGPVDQTGDGTESLPHALPRQRRHRHCNQTAAASLHPTDRTWPSTQSMVGPPTPMSSRRSHGEVSPTAPRVDWSVSRRGPTGSRELWLARCDEGTRDPDPCPRRLPR